MIKEILIKNIATYDDNGVIYDNLNKVNFFYGSNGSGKTSLSNVVKQAKEYPDAEITWTSNSLKTLVYNQKFVEENFHQDTEIKGIFTLGKESGEIKNQITEKKKLFDKLDDEIRGLHINLENKAEEYRKNEEDFIEDCWELKKKYDIDFSQAFSGVRNNKLNFMLRCKEFSTVDTQLCDLNDLRKRSYELYKGDLKQLNLIKKINMEQLDSICNNQIFSNQIVGKQDLEIAKLISRLAISDWVKRGYDHIHESDGVCPFCQQILPRGFIEKLEEYFNKVYENEIEELNRLISAYKNLYLKLESEITELLNEEEVTFMDISKIKQQYEVIKSKNEINLEYIIQKQNSPSKSISLFLFDEFLNNINNEIERVNQEINNHNDLVKNRTQEEMLLKKQIWKFITSENRHNHDKHVRREFTLNQAINGIKNKITIKKGEQKKLKDEIEGLEAQITSVIPTVNEINRLLKAYNFTNFEFAQSDGNYHLVRSNGENVNQSLSEGEKTFVTFLYFMHLLSGSNSRDLISENKVVVIDDPISSLDSNVLFIVSNLILKLIENVRKNEGYVVQLFILTHNIYFHKEVTFNKKRPKDSKLNDETFWIIRKTNNTTKAQQYEYNPIKTSYELMWQELKIARSGSSTTVQNLIRRIIENYFKVFGNYSEEDILNKFDEEERLICKSLLSWANDGSHFSSDDIYVEHPADIINRYLDIFEKIFIVTHHHAHYKMMMGLEMDTSEETLVNVS